jgi:hypothetical protein
MMSAHMKGYFDSRRQGIVTEGESSFRNAGNDTNCCIKIVVCRDSCGRSLQSCYCGLKLSVGRATNKVSVVHQYYLK